MSKTGDFIPYEKSSNKKKKELDRKKRQDWGDLNPITRKEDKNAYKRKKQREKEESYDY